MDDEYFAVLVQIAGTPLQKRRPLVASLDRSGRTTAMTPTARAVINLLLGRQTGGSAAKAWMHLVVQEATRRRA